MKAERSRNLLSTYTNIYWVLSLLLIVLSLVPAMLCTIASANDIINVDKSSYHCNLTSEIYPETEIQLANSTSTANIPDTLIEQAQLAVQSRYKMHDIFGFVENMDQEKSFDLLLQLWQLVIYNYYLEIDRSNLVERALIELQIAIKSKTIRENYSISEQDSTFVANEIQSVINKLKSKDEIDFSWLKSQLQTISNSCVKIGLENSWPVMEMVFGICDNLDAYSRYLLPKRYKEMLDSLKGNYKGIGIDIIFRENNYPLVFDVVDGSPASKAGIKPGDLLVEIDNNSLNNADEYQYDNVCSDASEDSFDITVQRDSKTFNYTLKKEYVTASDVRNVKTLINATTGFIRISSFGRNTAEQTESALQQLIDNGVESLIIDLRNNGGGMVSSAIETADLFLGDGEIVSFRSYEGLRTYIAGADNKQSEEISIVILVNKETASAAELFTAALKHNNRAIVIGKTTYGKAVMQTVFDLEHDAGALVLTTAEYLPPSGESFNLKGIIPNIEVVNTENAEICDENQCINDRISENNIVMRTALKCLSN